MSDSTLTTSPKLTIWTANLCSSQPEISSLPCASSWSTSFPWAKRHLGLLTDLYAAYFPIIQIMEWLFFFFNLSVNKKVYLWFSSQSSPLAIVHSPLATGECVEYNSKWGIPALLSRHLPDFGALRATDYRLLLNCPNFSEDLSKCKMNGYQGSNTIIRQITHQYKPDSTSLMFSEEKARSFTSTCLFSTLILFKGCYKNRFLRHPRHLFLTINILYISRPSSGLICVLSCP